MWVSAFNYLGFNRRMRGCEPTERLQLFFVSPKL